MCQVQDSYTLGIVWVQAKRNGYNINVVWVYDTYKINISVLSDGYTFDLCDMSYAHNEYTFGILYTYDMYRIFITQLQDQNTLISYRMGISQAYEWYMIRIRSVYGCQMMGESQVSSLYRLRKGTGIICLQDHLTIIIICVQDMHMIPIRWVWALYSWCMGLA